MYTINDYLNSLENDKNNLVNYLTIKGQIASTDETFTTLVPKVLDISAVNNQSKSITVTSNNIYTLTPDTGYTGLSSAEVTVDVNPSLQSKSETITENGTITITPDTGYYGLESVSVTTNIPSGKVSVGKKDVNFYDFENTRLYSYTKAEFLQLNAFPSVPDMAGFTSQGWNWGFAEAQAYVQEYGILNIGAVYVPTDGKTKLYITISTDGFLDLPLNFTQSASDGVTVDWGDESETETFSSTTVQTTHHYNSPGSYIITMLADNNVTYTLGRNSSNGIIGSIQDKDYVYRSMLNKVIMGTGAEFLTFGMYGCYQLKEICLGNSITTTKEEVFEYTNISIIIIPPSVKILGNQVFYRMPSLQRVVFSGETLTSGPGQTFFFQTQGLSELIIPNTWPALNNNFASANGTYSLTSIIFPKSITNINTSCFSGLYVKYLDFSHHEAVPTIASGTFGSLQSYTKIIVPDNLYESWIAEANWSSYSSNIIKKSDWDAL